jgi:hypothetical protein
MNNPKDIVDKMMLSLSDGRDSAWEDFKRTQIINGGDDLEPHVLAYLHEVFLDGFGRGTLFASTYIAKITLEEQLNQLMGKSNTHATPPSINKIPDDLGDITRN